MLPTFAEETKLWKQGYQYIFGLDEAGRGCLAGPVYAGVVAWKQGSPTPEGIKDSKLISATKREALFTPIAENSLAHGIASANPQEIDRYNILNASSLAILRALEDSLSKIKKLNLTKLAFFSDGKLPLLGRAEKFLTLPEFKNDFPITRKLFQTGFQELCFIKGDSKSISIASASILAKVSRDRLLINMHEQYPEYQFAKHKGYSTALHKELLLEHGPSDVHRYSFSPVREAKEFNLSKF